MNLLRTHLCRRLPTLSILWSSPTLDDLNRLAGELNCPVRFCEHQPQSAQDYEATISGQSKVPTRVDTWHDRLNAAMWLLWPQTKLALNHAHMEDLCGSEKTSNRSRRRDALTLVDEAGLVLLSTNSRWFELNRQHQWLEMFWHRRQAWDVSVLPLIVGHGLAEQLLNPYIGLTAKVIHLQIDTPPNDTCPAEADQALAITIRDQLTDPSTLLPLPVLGIPGWYTPQSPAFYGNERYFRPARRR